MAISDIITDQSFSTYRRAREGLSMDAQALFMTDDYTAYADTVNMIRALDNTAYAMGIIKRIPNAVRGPERIHYTPIYTRRES